MRTVIREIRQERGLTQDQLAELSRVPRICISRYESGKYYPILNDYIAYTSVGKELDFADYLEGIQGGNETYMFNSFDVPEGVSADSVTIRSYVNYEKPGVYKVI